MKNTLITILFGISLITTTFSQNIFNAPPSYLSLNMGFSVMDDLLPEAIEYSPTTFLASIPIWQKGRMTVYSEVQFAQNFEGSNSKTQFAKDLLESKPRSDWEFGLNFGFLYQQPMFNNIKLTGAIATGPNYITLNTSRQAHGFIFSDNVELGLVYAASKRLDINLKARYRHISNAGLESPNGGIDNLFLIIGLTKHFSKNQ
jgi:Lipid A 3-O-deacylase (PagL)